MYSKICIFICIHICEICTSPSACTFAPHLKYSFILFQIFYNCLLCIILYSYNCIILLLALNIFEYTVRMQMKRKCQVVWPPKTSKNCSVQETPLWCPLNGASCAMSWIWRTWHRQTHTLKLFDRYEDVQKSLTQSPNNLYYGMFWGSYEYIFVSPLYSKCYKYVHPI